MLDPNFRRSVLFISSHDPQEGAMGVILNRPLDKQVADLVGDPPPDGLADVPVFLGGPVGKNQLMFAAFEWEDANGLQLNHNVNVDEAHEMVGDDPGRDPRVCRLCRLERGPARSGDEAEGVDLAKAEPRRAHAGASAEALVRDHARARALVQAARRRAGRSVTKLVTSDG